MHYLLHLHCPPLIFLQRLVVASICCSRSCLFTLLLVSFAVLSALLGGDHRPMLTWKSCVEIKETAAARCPLIWWRASQCWWGLRYNSIYGANIGSQILNYAHMYCLACLKTCLILFAVSSCSLDLKHSRTTDLKLSFPFFSLEQADGRISSRNPSKNNRFPLHPVQHNVSLSSQQASSMDFHLCSHWLQQCLPYSKSTRLTSKKIHFAETQNASCFPFNV